MIRYADRDKKRVLEDATNQLKCLLNLSSASNDIASASDDLIEATSSVSSSKVDFYSDSLYSHHKKRSSKVIFASDGSLGYGGSEYNEEFFNYWGAPEDKKYKWQVLWKDVPEDIRNSIILDSVSLFSVTDLASADQMSEMLLNLQGVNESSSITDCTACSGGNSFSFMKYFSIVNAIELHSIRSKVLQQNLDVFSSFLGMKSKVNVFNGDCLEVIGNEIPFSDILFFDPPWGGEAYKKRQEIKLFLSTFSMGEVCKKLSSFCTFLAIKMPGSNAYVDETKIIDESGCEYLWTAEVGNKMRLLVLKSRKLSQKQVDFFYNIGR